MERFIHCVYASTATFGFAEHDIPALLEKARARNARDGVTGMLLYIEGSFFQVLEGDETAVSTIFAAIKKDARHTRVTEIIREPIAHRSFADWSMGFSAVGLEEAGTLIGENDFFTRATCIDGLGSGRAKKLLQAFHGGSWRADRTGKFQSRGGSA